MSIKQVAALAGVSHATVSNVINQRPHVDPSTAETVRAAMRELNYRPRPVGQRPGRRPRSADGIRSGKVALVWPRDTAARSSIGCALMEGLSAELARRSLKMRVSFLGPHGEAAGTGEPGGGGGAEAAERFGRVVREADGCLVLGAGDQESLQELRGKPVVWMGSHGPRDFGDRVACDNLQVAREAVAFLKGRGRDRLIYVSLDPAHPAFFQRKMAFLAEAPPAEARCVEAPAGTAPAERAAAAAALLRGLLGGLSEVERERVGLFVANDRSLGELDRECRRGGLDLTARFPVVACDHEDAALCGLLRRPATFELQPARIAALAVERLCERMKNPDTGGQTTVSIPAVFVPPVPPVAARGGDALPGVAGSLLS